MKKKKFYGFAIVGCGGVARIHAEAIKNIDNAKLVAVFDNNDRRAREFAATYGCKSYNNLAAMLADEAVEIVSICTPSGLHAPLAIEAANAGKHIILEKPMAITYEQLSDIIAAVEKNGVKAEIVSQLRFTKSIMQAKNAIENGYLGKLLHADFIMQYNRTQEYYDSSDWRGTWAMDGGGALMNQGVHGIDLLQYLMGGVKSVYAQCRTLTRNIETEDTAYILAEYKCGAVGMIKCTTCCNPGYARKLIITGTEGTIIIKEDEIVAWDIAGKEYETTKSVINSSSDPLNFSHKYHQLQFSDLINTIATDGKPIVDVYSGSEAVKIILAAYKSSREGVKVEL